MATIPEAHRAGRLGDIRWIRLSLLACLPLVAFLTAPSPKRHVVLDVFPRVCMAPCNLTLKAIVDPQSDQRRLDLALDCDTGFSTSHAVWLEGEEGPRLSLLSVRDVPAGACEASATLLIDRGAIATIARQTVSIQ